MCRCIHSRRYGSAPNLLITLEGGIFTAFLRVKCRGTVRLKSFITGHSANKQSGFSIFPPRAGTSHTLSRPLLDGVVRDSTLCGCFLIFTVTQSWTHSRACVQDIGFSGPVGISLCLRIASLFAHFFSLFAHFWERWEHYLWKLSLLIILKWFHNLYWRPMNQQCPYKNYIFVSVCFQQNWESQRRGRSHTHQEFHCPNSIAIRLSLSVFSVLFSQCPLEFSTVEPFVSVSCHSLSLWMDM